jgi:hypothetical protein
MKVLSLRPLNDHPDMFSFALQIQDKESGESFIINGFVYSAKSGAVMSPTTFKRRRMVRAFGAWRKLRAEVERQLAEGTPGVKLAETYP